MRAVCLMESPPELTCNGGEKKTHADLEFCYSPDRRSYEDANKFCEDNNLELVTPSSMQMAKAINIVCDSVKDELEADVNCTWLSLKCDGSESCLKSNANWKYDNEE